MKNILLFVCFLIVAIVGFITISLYHYSHELASAETITKSEISALTESVSKDLNYILSDAGRDIKLIASMLAGDYESSHEIFDSIFDNYYKTNSYFMNLWFVDKNGAARIVAPEKYKTSVGNNYSFREWFKNAKKYKHSVYSEVLENYRPKDTEERYNTIVIATPVFKSQGEFAGVVGSDLDLAKIGERIKIDALSMPSKRGLYLFDYKNAKILAGDHNGKNQKLIDFLLNVLKQGSSEVSTTRSYTFKGEKYFISSSFIKDKNYTFGVLGVFPYSETLAFIPKYFRQTKWLAFYMIIIICLALAIVIYNEKVFKKLKKKIQILEVDINYVEKQEALAEILDNKFYKQLAGEAKKKKSDK